MTLATGTKLGPYEIVALLGAGGMSACGPASERSETSRAHGDGAPCALINAGGRAHAGVRRWRNEGIPIAAIRALLKERQLEALFNARRRSPLR